MPGAKFQLTHTNTCTLYARAKTADERHTQNKAQQRIHARIKFDSENNAPIFFSLFRMRVSWEKFPYDEMDEVCGFMEMIFYTPLSIFE